MRDYKVQGKRAWIQGVEYLGLSMPSVYHVCLCRFLSHGNSSYTPFYFCSEFLLSVEQISHIIHLWQLLHVVKTIIISSNFRMEKLSHREIKSLAHLHLSLPETEKEYVIQHRYHMCGLRCTWENIIMAYGS